MIDIILMFTFIFVPLIGVIILLYGTSLSLEEKCPLLDISSKEINLERAFNEFFNKLTVKEQHEYIEKIKNDPSYKDSFADYFRSFWNCSNNTKSNSKDV